MATYAQMVMQIRREAADELQRWTSPQLLGATREKIIETMLPRFEQREFKYSSAGVWMEERTPFKPSDGVRVFLPVERIGHAQSFLNIQPSTATREPPLHVDSALNAIFFDVPDPARVQDTLDIVKRNIDQRNRDIRQLAPQIRTHVEAAVDAAILRARDAEAEAERAMQQLEASGIPLRRTPFPPGAGPLDQSDAARPLERGDTSAGTASTERGRGATVDLRRVNAVFPRQEDQDDAIELLDKVRRHLAAIDDDGNAPENVRLIAATAIPMIDELRVLILTDAGSAAARPGHIRRVWGKASAAASALGIGAMLLGGIAAGGVAANNWVSAAAQLDDAVESIQNVQQMIDASAEGGDGEELPATEPTVDTASN